VCGALPSHRGPISALSINLKTLRLAEIYETRERFTNISQPFARLFLITWWRRPAIPVALVYFFIRKNMFYRHCFFDAWCISTLFQEIKQFTSPAMMVVFFYYIGKNHVSKLQ